jgi:hypothetical protein
MLCPRFGRDYHSYCPHQSPIHKLIYRVIGVATFLSVFALYKKFGANPFPWRDYGELSNAIIQVLISNYHTYVYENGEKKKESRTKRKSSRRYSEEA